jgi:hypothetical protein
MGGSQDLDPQGRGGMSIKGDLWGHESGAFLLFLFFRQLHLFWRVREGDVPDESKMAKC